MKQNLLLIVLVIVAVLMGVIAFGTDPQRDFMAGAEKARGVIASKDERVVEGERTEYWVTYSYRDKYGNRHTTQLNLADRGIWDRLRPGQVEEIYYDKDNPSKSQLGMVLDKELGRD